MDFLFGHDDHGDLGNFGDHSDLTAAYNHDDFDVYQSHEVVEPTFQDTTTFDFHGHYDNTHTDHDDTHIHVDGDTYKGDYDHNHNHDGDSNWDVDIHYDDGEGSQPKQQAAYVAPFNDEIIDKITSTAQNSQHRPASEGSMTNYASDNVQQFRSELPSDVSDIPTVTHEKLPHDVSDISQYVTDYHENFVSSEPVEMSFQNTYQGWSDYFKSITYLD